MSDSNIPFLLKYRVSVPGVSLDGLNDEDRSQATADWTCPGTCDACYAVDAWMKACRKGLPEGAPAPELVVWNSTGLNPDDDINDYDYSDGRRKVGSVSLASALANDFSCATAREVERLVAASEKMEGKS